MDYLGGWASLNLLAGDSNAVAVADVEGISLDRVSCQGNLRSSDVTGLAFDDRCHCQNWAKVQKLVEVVPL